MKLYKRDGIYYLKYYDEKYGNLRRISTKTKNHSEALKFLTNFKNEVKNRTRFPLITLEEFVEEYQEYARISLSKSYSRCIKYTMSLVVSELGTSKQISSISARDFEKFFLKRYQTSKYAAHNYFRTVKSAFSKAVEWGYIPDNPLRKIKLPRLPKPFPLFINSDDLNLILENEKVTDYRDVYLLAFYTGMRLNEITNLTWSAVNFKLNEIIVKNSDDFVTKSKSERIIPMNEITTTLLIKREKNVSSHSVCKYVFEKVPGIKYRGETISRNFKNAVINLELNPKLHFHSLRHSFASNLAMRGVSLYVIKELLGHSDYATTQIYAHLQRESLQKAIRLLN